jgi:hypothetical protein
MKEPKSYDEALKYPSSKIWCGCGDGRKKKCGRIHNYGTIDKPDFRCWMNNEHGCPEKEDSEVGLDGEDAKNNKHTKI